MNNILLINNINEILIRLIRKYIKKDESDEIAKNEIFLMSNTNIINARQIQEEKNAVRCVTSQ